VFKHKGKKMKETKLLRKWEKKYFSLVWYARKGQDDHPMWANTPDCIKQKAFNEMSRIREMHPDEVDALCGESGDWTHGFNSGMLACLRFVLTAQNPEWINDPAALDDGKPFCLGGVEQALEAFPDLDT
jgi:hypothetical protein